MTAESRIRWAIKHSGKTLQQLAAKLGCSHAAISQWKNGETPVANIKSGHLMGLADETGVELRWLLTGRGPVISRYVLTSEMERVGMALKAMERFAPAQTETIIRMIEAAADAAAGKVN